MTGAPPSALAALAASAAASPPCPSGEPVPTMPGPIEQTATSKPCAAAQASAEATPTACASPPTDAPAAIAISTRPRSFNARSGIRKRDRQRPAGELDVRDPHALPDARRGGHDLRVERAADDGHPVQARRRARRPPRRIAQPLEPACTAASSRARPAPAPRPSPRVRFACSTSNPPEPSPSSRACTFTSTSSPTSIGPVNRGYATHDSPSTSIRASPSSSSTIAVTVPRRRLSGIRLARHVHERERDVDHPLEVRRPRCARRACGSRPSRSRG